MKSLQLILIIFFAFAAVAGQQAVDEIVSTEREFARRAGEQGIKSALLEFMTEDSVVFVPERVSGRSFWSASPDVAGRLLWAPNYADAASNGLLGYTVGTSQYRAADSGAVEYGDFATIWQRRPDGKFRWVLDVGVNHSEPHEPSQTRLAPADYAPSANEKASSAADTANGFYQLAAAEGLKAAYKQYAAPNVRALREGAESLVGRDRLLSYTGRSREQVSFAKRSSFYQSADIGYTINTFTATAPKSAGLRGNFIQVWKLIDGRWKIVLDVFKPAPTAKNQ